MNFFLLGVFGITIVARGSDILHLAVGQFRLIPSRGLLLYSSPARLSVYIKTNTSRAVLVLDDFLNSAYNARLSGGEL
jgi:hypothetical protein